VLIGLVSGKVSYKPPGASKFLKLAASTIIPTRSILDTTHGKVALTSARDSHGKLQTGRFNGGKFKVSQGRSSGAYTVLSLTGPAPRACNNSRNARGARKRKRRRLFGSAKGRFRTRGKYAAGTVRGTKWSITDRSDGTLISVSQGTVSVSDLVKHKTIRVRSHHRYLARPRNRCKR
jgi:hypothetical protein